MDEKFDKRLGGIEQQIEKLAQITAQGFADVDKRFADVDKRFTDVDKRFDNLEQNMNRKFDGVNNRIDDLAETRAKTQVLENLNTRITALEEKVLH